MKQEKWVVGILTVLVLLTVGIVSFLSFAMSYDVLWSHALAGGKSETLAKYWPLIIDFPIVAFSLVAMLLAFMGTRWSWLPRAGVVVVTALTVYFNYTHATTNGLDWQIAIMAPIMYAVSFECVILVIGLLTSRGVAIQKVKDIKTELDNLQDNWQKEQDNIEGERRQLIGQLHTANRQIATAKETMTRLKQETKEITQQPTLTYLPDNLPVEIRQEIVKNMVADKQTIKAMAALLGVSEGTIKNDKVAITNRNGI